MCNVAGYFRRFSQIKSDGFLTGSRVNPIKNKLNDYESQMTVLSPVTTRQRQEVLVGKWNPPPVTVIQALPALTAAEIMGKKRHICGNWELLSSLSFVRFGAQEGADPSSDPINALAAQNRSTPLVGGGERKSRGGFSRSTKEIIFSRMVKLDGSSDHVLNSQLSDRLRSWSVTLCGRRTNPFLRFRFGHQQAKKMRPPTGG